MNCASVIYDMWWQSVLKGFLVIEQSDAQSFESSRYQYLFFIFFLVFVIFPANFKNCISMQNLIKIYGAAESYEHFH